MKGQKTTNLTKSTLWYIFVLFGILAGVGFLVQLGLVFSGLVDNFSILGFFGAIILIINAVLIVSFSIMVANTSERNQNNRRPEEDEKIIDILIDEIKKQTKNGPNIDWTGRH